MKETVTDIAYNWLMVN